MSETRPLVLVVEADAESRTRLYAVLDGPGSGVATAAGGVDALRDVAQLKPDVVVTSVQTGDVPARKFFEEIRRISPRSRVVALAAPRDLPRFAGTLDASADEVLLEPAGDEEIAAAVRRVLPPLPR